MRTASTISLVTWNVWFSARDFEPRFRALLDVVRSRDPDVVCFQEIIPESLELLLDEPWVRSRYALSDTTGESFDSYGVVMLSRLPVGSFSFRELPTSMGRRLLTADVTTAAGPITIGTVHLESMKHNAETRGEQLAEIFPALRGRGPDSILCGDFNFCSTWPEENGRIEPDFIDVWPALHPREPGWSEDTTVNRMLESIEGRTKKVRYDRVLLRSPVGRWQPRSIELLGTEPISPGEPFVFPSDHFGLAAVFEASTP